MNGPVASGPECRYEKLGCFEIGHPVQAEIAKNQKSIVFLRVLEKLDNTEAGGPVEGSAKVLSFHMPLAACKPKRQNGRFFTCKVDLT